MARSTTGPSPVHLGPRRPTGLSFGYMDVALHPKYKEKWIYLCYIDEVPELSMTSPTACATRTFEAALGPHMGGSRGRLQTEA